MGLVSPGDYREDVKHTVMFLEGRNEEVIRELTAPMQKAADGLDYERAAQYRDQIISLRKIQENQYITAPRGELDIVACYMEGGYACVQVFFIRGGLNLGNKAFFPGHTGELTEAQVLNAFLPQYYLTGSRNRPAPGQPPGSGCGNVDDPAQWEKGKERAAQAEAPQRKKEMGGNGVEQCGNSPEDASFLQGRLRIQVRELTGLIRTE